ncbi:MAG TPA: hypothetical protein VLE89_06655 [Chlamydiales bacterium]|nr:hypothetical protein [Chlamydiales bacterium]
MKQIQTNQPTPILNTPDFSYAFGGKNGKEIPLDAKGHPFCFEFVALKGTPFTVEKEFSSILQVSCSFYPSSPLFLDRRFVTSYNAPFSPQLPEKKIILERMEKLTGTPYVWGGNWSPGIPEMLSYYPPKDLLDEKTKTYWSLAGVDCSGLLYQATGGATPRNTSQLIHYGKALKINDLPQPLDMIIYPGHVLFVLNANFSIESKFPFGVIQRPLKERLEELGSFVDEWTPDLDPTRHFMIRRFCK